MSSPSYNLVMRAMIGILLATAIGIGTFYFMFKQSAPGTGTTTAQQISLTGVNADLLSIAQAERMYWAQNGTYVDLNKLTSSGTLTMQRTGRDGYAYSVDASDNGFTVTARYTAVPASGDANAQHYPVVTIDQTMEIHQSD